MLLSYESHANRTQAVADEAFSDICEYLTLSSINLDAVPFLDRRMQTVKLLRDQVTNVEMNECT